MHPTTKELIEFTDQTAISKKKIGALLSAIFPEESALIDRVNKHLDVEAIHNMLGELNEKFYTADEIELLLSLYKAHPVLTRSFKIQEEMEVFLQAPLGAILTAALKKADEDEPTDISAALSVAFDKTNEEPTDA